jgi:hypothetical protein
MNHDPVLSVVQAIRDSLVHAIRPIAPRTILERPGPWVSDCSREVTASLEHPVDADTTRITCIACLVILFRGYPHV